MRRERENHNTEIDARTEAKLALLIKELQLVPVEQSCGAPDSRPVGRPAAA